MSPSVTITDSAERDLRAIIGWLEQRSPSGAETWYRRWLEVLCRLEESGHALGVAPENEDHEETIRQVLFKTRRGLPYRAIYVVREQQLFVLHVRGPGQDLMKPDEIELPD